MELPQMEPDGPGDRISSYQIYQVSETDGSGTNRTSLSYLNVPLLVGVNLSRTVSLVFTPGATWGFASSGKIRFTNGPDQGSTTGAIGRFGVGADFRITPGFALPPGDHVLARLLGGENEIDYIAGLGFNFGAMPNYDDVGGGPPPPRRRRRGTPRRRQAARPRADEPAPSVARFRRQCRDPIGNRTRYVVERIITTSSARRRFRRGEGLDPGSDTVGQRRFPQNS